MAVDSTLSWWPKEAADVPIVPWKLITWLHLLVCWSLVSKTLHCWQKNLASNEFLVHNSHFSEMATEWQTLLILTSRFPNKFEWIVMIHHAFLLLCTNLLKCVSIQLQSTNWTGRWQSIQLGDVQSNSRGDTLGIWLWLSQRKRCSDLGQP